MPEEKEITLEEIQRLVDLSAVLPELLDRINEINKSIKALNAKFETMQTKFNDNTKAVISYKESVDALIKNQLKAKDLENALDEVKKELLDKIEALTPEKKKVAPKEEEPKEAKPKAAKAKEAPKKDDKKADAEEKDKINGIIDKIFAAARGRKKRILTEIDVKKGFDVDSEMAQKVLKKLTDMKFYNPDTKTLLFPKK